MPARTIEDIQKEYFSALSNNETAGFDISEGSFLYTLSRANASVSLNNDIDLERLTNASYLGTAESSDLDFYGSSYGLPRKSATFATGFVSAIATDDGATALPPSLILTDLDTGNQYRCADSSKTISNVTESRLAVVAIESGSQSNLPAGTALYSSSYPTVEFKVGATRLKNGNYCGSISGGNSIESDRDYRLRISTKLASFGTVTETSLTNYLASQPGLDRVYVRTETPGMTTVWFGASNSEDEQTKAQLITSIVTPYLPLGTGLSVVRVDIIPIDITLRVKPYNSNSEYREALANTVSNFFANLSPAETFYPFKLVALAAAYVSRAEIETPAETVEGIVGIIFSLGTLTISEEV